MTDRIGIYRPLEKDLWRYPLSSDAYRNILGYIPTSDIVSFLDRFNKNCLILDVPILIDLTTLRIQFLPSNFTREVEDLSQRQISFMGLSFRHPIISVGLDENFRFQFDHDESRLLIWVDSSIQYKALTKFRRFLFKHILRYKDWKKSAQTVASSCRELEMQSCELH